MKIRVYISKKINKISLILVFLIIFSFIIVPTKCDENEKESIIKNFTTIKLIEGDILTIEMKYIFDLNDATINRLKKGSSGAFISLSSNGISSTDHAPDPECLLNKQKIDSKPFQYDSYMYFCMVANVDALQRSELSFFFDIEASQFRINEGIIEFEVVFNKLTHLFDDIPHKFDLIVCSESNEWSGWLWTLESQWISDCLVHESPLYKIEDLPKKHKIQFNQSKVLRLNQSYFIGYNGDISQEFDMSLEILYGELRFQIPYLAGMEKPNIDDSSYIIVKGEKKYLNFYEDLSDPKEILERGAYGWSHDDNSNSIILACSDPDAKKIDIKYTNENLNQICQKKREYVYECKFPILISPPFKDELILTIDTNGFHIIHSDPDPKSEKNGKLIYKFEEELPKFIKLEYAKKEKIVLDRIKKYNTCLTLFPVVILIIIIFLKPINKLVFSGLWRIKPVHIFLSSALTFFGTSMEYYIVSFPELKFFEFIRYTRLWLPPITFGMVVFMGRLLQRKIEKTRLHEQERVSKQRTQDTGIQ